jgi:multidrug efflux system membrane fusion protein
MRLSVALFSLLLSASAAPAADSFVVHATDVVDRKAVIATVEPIHQLVARARIGGTITSLTVHVGDTVAAGAEIAVVVDQKLALQMKALDSRIASQQSTRDQAKIDFDRASELQKRGVGTQTQLDQSRTNLEVAERNLSAMSADRSVIAQEATEGAVLAPGAGRALIVPVSEGQVILPGETIATLAEDKYILRLQLPESHARFMRAGDTVLIGARGMQSGDAEKMREGKVRLVYPEIQGGRVVADVDVSGLGDYFVGERTRAYINAGPRRTILVPSSYVFRRAGVNYARLAEGDEVVVQPGETRGSDVEILAGLKDGDKLVAP